MTTKFVEVLISYKYRVVDEEGHMAGGAHVLHGPGMNMRWLAVLFARLHTSFGTGSMPQANNIAQAMDALAPYGPGRAAGARPGDHRRY